MKNIKFIIIAVVILFVSFFAGIEYKAYQVRNAFDKAFNTNTTTSTEDKTVAEKAKEENMEVYTKKIGDELTLQTLTLKVIDVKEDLVIDAKYGAPITANDGAKFVIVSLTVKNIAKSTFSFDPDAGLVMVDAQGREYKKAGHSFWDDTSLDGKDLSPGVPETGYIVYELPNDATNYSLVTSKTGSKDLYKIVLK